MKNIAKVILLPLLLVAMIFIKPTFAYWATPTVPSMFNATALVMIGDWPLPLEIDYEYEAGDEFIFDDQVWEVVDITTPVGPGETRMLVIVPGEGLVLVAITGDGSGHTIVVRIHN